jgi:nucleoside-diphosphate-sugar epimerase
VKTLQIVMKKNVAPVFGPARTGDVRDSQADNFKARKLLDYEPTVSFEEGLRRTVAWHSTAKF